MIIYGIHSVIEALEAEQCRLTRIQVRRGKGNPRLQTLIDLARTRSVPVSFESPVVLNRKAGTTRHQDVIAEISEVAYREIEEVLASAPDLLVLIDGVEDPHNLGAVIRTADAVGAGAILLPQRHTCGITPAVVKASAGAALHVPMVRIGNVAQTLAKIKEEGFWVAGLDREGPHTPAEITVDVPLLVIVGGEHRGVRRLVKENCDFLVSLPMLGKVSSLNLSVAAGILLYQILQARQKLKGTGQLPL